MMILSGVFVLFNIGSAYNFVNTAKQAEFKIYGIINVVAFVAGSILLIKYIHGCYLYHSAAEPKKDD